MFLPLATALTMGIIGVAKLEVPNFKPHHNCTPDILLIVARYFLLSETCAYDNQSAAAAGLLDLMRLHQTLLLRKKGGRGEEEKKTISLLKT